MEIRGMSRSVPELEDARRQQASIRARCVHPSRTFIPFPEEELDQSIQARFEQQAGLYPDAIAVRTRDQALTFRALNQAANRLAHALLARLGEELVPAALLCEKEAPLVVAMFGALKAGKIKVPLDPSFPRARLAYILEDSLAQVLVTHSAHLELARALAGDRYPILNLDDFDAGLPTENPALAIPPDACAQIMYTSGSTGQPKGVVADHRRLLHAVMRRTNDFGICAHDRALCIAQSPNAFLQPLLNGAALYLANTRRDGFAGMTEWLIDEAVTMYSSSASAFRYFTGTLTGAEQFPHLRLIKLGGEPVLKSDIELYKQHFADHCIFVNGLGTTETGNFCHFFVDKQSEFPDALVPAGYAVEETEILLLDEEGRPVPAGEIGEIAVRSRHLALGYWRQPDLTRAAFRPDPEGSEARLYLTGDLGRFLPDGCLLHLGRKDFQVKIRGHRVEIAEIESALGALPAVQQAAVIAREDRPGEPRLVAYLVPASRSAPTVSGLRRALAQTLPSFMLPSAFVFLEALPLTGIGKVDRRSLPAPDGRRPELETPFVAPRTPVEGVVAGIWEQLLGVAPVGIHDRFLELGGHSLLATQVVSRLEEAFRMELGQRVVFEAPTVGELAWELEAREPEAGWVAGMARARQQIESMSAAEVRAALEQQKART